MIDIHSHILFGVDDGSQTIENSIKMAKEAADNGYTHICCTPHFLEPEYISNWNDNEKRLDEFKEKLSAAGINIELRLGNEIFISESTLADYKEGKCISLNESKYVLVELPLINELRCGSSIIDQLILNGKKVILAHPERYKYVQNNLKFVEKMIEKGVIIQCNVGSVAGMYGEGARKCFNELLKREMVHILASDAHKTKSVYYKVDRYIEKIKEKVSPDYLEEMILTNPTYVLNDQKFEVREYKKKKRFLFF